LQKLSKVGEALHSTNLLDDCDSQICNESSLQELITRLIENIQLIKVILKSEIAKKVMQLLAS
jgi:hypothetical protein